MAVDQPKVTRTGQAQVMWFGEDSQHVFVHVCCYYYKGITPRAQLLKKSI